MKCLECEKECLGISFCLRHSSSVIYLYFLLSPVRQISILRELWRSQQGNVCEMKRRETVTNGWKEQERLQSDMGWWWWWWGTMAHKNNRLCSVRSGVRVTQPVKNYYSSAFTFQDSSASSP